MPERLRDVMTRDPVAVTTSATLVDAAALMRDRDIGDVIVRREDGSVCGIITDRDIVVQGVAGGRDPSTITVDEACSHDLVTLSSNDAVSRAVDLMKGKAIRRLPVIDDGELVGVVSLGDLAEDRDPGSALGEISSAPPNN
jgi:CBS domain-containing protein